MLDAFKIFRRKVQSSQPSVPDYQAGLPVFCIVTPVYNGSTYIDDTIHSVLSQAGDFILHYHVQDGGSTDDTMERVRRWMTLSEELPKVCRGLVFTCSSEPDTGMYDAINKGFARALPPGDDVVMGWIAADDRIAQGACATIAGIRNQFPDVRFLGGRVSLLGESGSIIGVHPIYPFSRRCMAAGLYDGRTLPFIMQEGSFWCADLWRKVGGLDTSFRLAGDWDLWRKMAVHEPYIMADTILGFHRRRPGQLSEAMGGYYDEVDRNLRLTAPASLPEIIEANDAYEAIRATAEPTWGTIYDSIAAEYEIIKVDAPRFRTSAHAATVVRYNLERKLWERMHGFGAVAISSELVTVGGTADSKAIIFKNGLHSPEGPYPEFGMLAPIRWMSGPLAEGEVQIDEPGRYRILVRCRSWTRDQTVTILADGKPLSRLMVPARGHDRDIELSATGTFAAGKRTIGILVEQPSAADRFLLMISAVVEQMPKHKPDTILPVPVQPIALAARIGDPPDGRWPSISIVVPTRNQGHFIRDTLDSIIRQTYPNLEIIVVDGQSTDETGMILREYASHLTHLISEHDNGQSEAINKGFRAASGEILTWLNSDDLLAEGALHAVAHAFMTSDADLVAGFCSVFDGTNRATHRHAPCVADGPLPLADLLDLENKWLRGQFFHQPEVFFRRRIWEKAGGTVNEQLFYSMDYDLWVRMAQHGATIRVIGSTIAHFRTHPAQKTSSPEVYRPELTAHAAAIRTRLALPPMPSGVPVKHRLKIVLFNDYGFKYGAGIAHRRIGKALAAAGHDVVPLAYADFDFGALSEERTAAEVAEAILSLRPDLVLVGNLHSIAADFDLLGALLPSDVPVVFYAHDQWIATGRCPYPEGCVRFTTRCDAACPTADLSPRLPRERVLPAFERKRAMVASNSRFAILTNSRYMRGFLQSALAPTGAPEIHVAPIGVDTSVFDAGDRWRARMILNLPQDRFIIVTAAANLADERKGLGLLLKALELIEDRKDILLLIMGFGEGLSHDSFEIRHTSYLHDEDLVALHYQAADLFVGPSLAEAFGQTYIEAGACGIPSVAFDVGGVGDAILAGVTGILVPHISAEALSEPIGRLKADVALRRQLGLQARLHACNNFSVAASAAKLITILVEDRALGLTLSPTVVLPAEINDGLHLEYMVEPANAPEHGALQWIPAGDLIEETHTPRPGGIAARFWWATSPGCRFMVRGEEDGPHILKLTVRCHVPGQMIAVSVNQGPEQLVASTDSDLDVLQLLQLPVELVKGLNRIDLGFTNFVQETVGSRRKLALLIENVAAVLGSPARGGLPKDGTYELVAGFDEEEGPYPEWGLPSVFHWALGRQSKMRVFSRVSGERHWTVRIRNGEPDQRLTIKIDNVEILSEVVGTRSLQIPLTVRFQARVDAGFHMLTFETSQQSKSDADPRRMAFMFEGLHLSSSDDADPISDGVRWDQSGGFGEEIAPAEHGTRPARPVHTRTPTLVYESSYEGPAILRLTYRSPLADQASLLAVNGQRCTPLDLRAGHAQSSSAHRKIILRRGQNFIDFEFLHATPSPYGSGEIAALIEDIAIWPATEESEEIPLDAFRLTYECGAGFGAMEEALPQLGLSSDFRWAIDQESMIRFNAPVTQVKLRLRNQFDGQTLDLFAEDGQRIATAELDADLALLQEVDVVIAAPGSKKITIRPRIGFNGGGEDRRHLTFILESLVDEHGRIIQASG